MRASVALLLAGCGPLMEADVTVTVPAAIRQAYDREAAGRVIMQIDHPKLGRTVALGLLCDPQDEDRLFYYNAVGLGCPKEPGTIEAWIEPADAADPSVTCGPSDEFFDDGYDVPRPAAGPYASARLWSTGGDCAAPITTVELVLEAPEGWANTTATAGTTASPSPGTTP